MESSLGEEAWWPIYKTFQVKLRKSLERILKTYEKLMQRMQFTKNPR